MTEENKYYPEEVLTEKVQSGEFDWLDYINHHSKEMQEEFEDFCKVREEKPDESTAWRFLELKQMQFDKALEDGDA